MVRERAKTFADRLPPVVTEEETDIAHLPDAMADILYPGRRPRPFRVAIEFEAFDGPEAARALQLARRSPLYGERQEHDRVLHHASFETRQASEMRALFQVVGRAAGHGSARGRQARALRDRAVAAAGLALRRRGGLSGGRRRRLRHARAHDPAGADRVGEVLRGRGEEAAHGNQGARGGADPEVRLRRDPEQHRAVPLSDPERALRDLQRAVEQAAPRDRGGTAGRPARRARAPRRPAPRLHAGAAGGARGEAVRARSA